MSWIDRQIPQSLRRAVAPIVMAIGAAISGGCNERGGQEGATVAPGNVTTTKGSSGHTVIQKDKIVSFGAESLSNPQKLVAADIAKDREYFKSLNASLDPATGTITVTGKSADGKDSKIEIPKGAAINFGDARTIITVKVNGQTRGFAAGFGAGVNDGSERTVKLLNETFKKAEKSLEGIEKAVIERDKAPKGPSPKSATR